MCGLGGMAYKTSAIDRHHISRPDDAPLFNVNLDAYNLPAPHSFSLNFLKTNQGDYDERGHLCSYYISVFLIVSGNFLQDLYNLPRKFYITDTEAVHTFNSSTFTEFLNSVIFVSFLIWGPLKIPALIFSTMS